jgi:hypothetical protein
MWELVFALRIKLSLIGKAALGRFFITGSEIWIWQNKPRQILADRIALKMLA